MKKIILLIITMTFFNILIVYAQKDYSRLDEKDKVVFSYKWKPSKFFKKDSPFMLLIMLENKNEYPVVVKFTIDYFWDTGRKASSDEQQFCIKANKTLKGRLKGLGFDNSVFSNEQLLDDRFTLELNEIKVDKTTVCGKK